jgi:hypothetical protein
MERYKPLLLDEILDIGGVGSGAGPRAWLHDGCKLLAGGGRVGVSSVMVQMLAIQTKQT